VTVAPSDVVYETGLGRVRVLANVDEDNGVTVSEKVFPSIVVPVMRVAVFPFDVVIGT
jgi:hypothetical protein